MVPNEYLILGLAVTSAVIVLLTLVGGVLVYHYRRVIESHDASYKDLDTLQKKAQLRNVKLEQVAKESMRVALTLRPAFPLMLRLLQHLGSIQSRLTVAQRATSLELTYQVCNVFKGLTMRKGSAANFTVEMQSDDSQSKELAEIEAVVKRKMEQVAKLDNQD